MKHGLMRTRIANGDWVRVDSLMPPGGGALTDQSIKDASAGCDLLQRAATAPSVPTFCLTATVDALVSGVSHLSGGTAEELSIPYPEMWLEYKVVDESLSLPARGCMFVSIHYNPGIGMLMTSYSTSRDAILGPTAEAYIPAVVGPNGGCVVQPTSSGLVELEYTPLVMQMTAEERRDLERVIDMEWRLVVYLLTMISCRNVEIVKREHRGEYDRKRRKFKGGYQYHTLVVRKQDKRIVYDSDPLLAPESPAALHMVRGHFKTYTSEAPLLGKLTGRYYWPPHARGSRAVREIEHEYRVG